MKIKQSIILFIFLLFCIKTFSQENMSETKKLESHLKTSAKVDFGLSGLGLSLDKPFSEHVLLEVAAGLGASYQINEDFKYRLYFDDPAFFATIHGKYYYKQDKVYEDGKNASFNSGKFFGIKVKYTSPTLRKEKMWHTLLTGFHWGLQRKLGKHFLYQLNIGVGAAIDVDSKTKTHVTLFPDANFRFSYVISFD